PRSPTRLTLCADVAPGGIGSEWFRGLKPGDAVRFKAPLGGFVFSRADPRRPLFVAEEIGIVPIRAILTELYATGFGRPATLAYWARDPGWLAYDAEFGSLARRYPGFVYHPVVAGAGGPARDGGGPRRLGDARREASLEIVVVRAEGRPRRLGDARREASLEIVVVRAEGRPRRLGDARREASLEIVVVRAEGRPRRLGDARREASLEIAVVRAEGRPRRLGDARREASL